MKCSNWNRKYVKMQKLCEKEMLAFISNDVRVFTFSYTRKIKRVVWMTATFFMSRFQMYLLFRIHLCSTSFQLTDFVFETFSLLSLSHLYYQIISCLSGRNAFNTFPPKQFLPKIFVNQTINHHTNGSVCCHH